MDWKTKLKIVSYMIVAVTFQRVSSINLYWEVKNNSSMSLHWFSRYSKLKSSVGCGCKLIDVWTL